MDITQKDLSAMRIAKKFELLLERYRLPDGRKWNGQELQNTTGGVVTRSYVSALKKGNIENPGFEKLQAVAKAMGFPPELWFEDIEDGGLATQDFDSIGDDVSVAERLERLFEMLPDERTGTPYTNAEVARMSLGDLTEEEIEVLRTGRSKNPTVSQVLALSEIFGVDPSYFLARGKRTPLLDKDIVQVLGDKRSLAIANKSLNLSEGEKDLVIDMIERLGHLHDGMHNGGEQIV